MLCLSVALVMALAVVPSPTVAAPLSPAQVRAATHRSAGKTVLAYRQTPDTRFSYLATSTVWSTCDANGWACGYLPGQLWLGYQLTDDSWYKTKAIHRERTIAHLKTTSGATDIGQRYYYSLARAYDMTGRASYRNKVLAAAKAQAARFSPVVGAVRSRNTTDTYQVIMDDLMNIQVLYWAARHGGSPAWAQVAHTHALTVARDFIRDDGSTYHMVCYDATSGAVVQRTTSQGYSADSTWARGQAWAIYGLSEAYRDTQDPTLLAAARRVSDYYVSHLPSDTVPYWDFQAPDIPDAPRDSSAAAVAASGLIQLSTLETDTARAQAYRSAAQDTLAALTSASYASTGTAMILDHGVLNYWTSSTRDCSLSFGDYFYFEALMRLRLLPSATPPLHVWKISSKVGKPKFAADKNMATSWKAKGKHWLQLDLGRKVPVSAVGIAVASGASRSAGFTISLSTDAKHWKTALKTRSSGATTGLERYDFATRTARYVRISCNGTTRSKTIGLAEVRAY
jgi:unsaturated chondroitin disaccharide hydrolase